MDDQERAVPVIDMKESPFPYAKIREACEEWGCFMVVNHGFSDQLMSEMKGVVASLHDLQMENKNWNGEVKPRGAYRKLSPIFQSFHLSNLGSADCLQAFCSELEVPHQLREVMERYNRESVALVMDIADKLAKSLGLSGGSDLFTGWPCNMRMNKYCFAPQTVGDCGAPLHTDASFLTLLQADDVVSGLEVVDSKSGSFVALPPCPGSFFVNLGDFAMAWSNGRFKSVKHRVQCTEGRVRFSIVVLLLPQDNVAIEAPEELISSQAPRLYVPFSCEDLMNLRQSKKLFTDEALTPFLAQS